MLITTIVQLRAASSINVSNNIDNWLPYLSDAEDVFIIPAIGQNLYDAIISYLNPDSNEDSESGNAGSEAQIPNPILDALILRVRKALSLYALYLGIDEVAVSVSGAGIQVLQSDTHKPAPQYQIMNLKETYISRAHRQMDLILSYIEKNYSELPAVDFPKYPYFIRNAEEFQLYADIHASRRVFLSLMPIMESVEKKFIKPTISELLFDDLKSKLQIGNSLSDDERTLLGYIMPSLAHLTMARALLEISIDILDWGVFNNSANTFNNIQNIA